MPIHQAVYKENEEVLHTLIHHGSTLDTRNNVSSNNTLYYSIHYVVIIPMVIQIFHY